MSKYNEKKSEEPIVRSQKLLDKLTKINKRRTEAYAKIQKNESIGVKADEQLERDCYAAMVIEQELSTLDVREHGIQYRDKDNVIIPNAFKKVMGFFNSWKFGNPIYNLGKQFQAGVNDSIRESGLLPSPSSD